MNMSRLQHRIASLDLLKLFAICGVLIIHMIGKTTYGGVFWYAQAVPIFMVLMGYNCRETINWHSLGKSYLSYFMLYIVSLIIAIILHKPFSIHYLPIGLLPFAGPGTYWILLYFLFVLVSPLIYRMKERMSIGIFLSLLFVLGYMFDVIYEASNSCGKTIYSSCPLRYALCFGLGMIIKEKSPFWFIKRMWWFAVLSAIYLYLRNYSSLDIPYLFFENAGWSTGENGFAAFYPAMLVALSMYLLKNMQYSKILFLGRLTYHVFLFQILWFAIFPHFITNKDAFTILTFVCCFLGGYVFSQLSNRFIK